MNAALYLASPEDAGAALARVSGRLVAFRVVLAAVRAGWTQIYVPAQFRHGPLGRAIATSPPARAAVVWLDAGDAGPAAPLLLLPAAVVISGTGPGALAAATPPALLAASRDAGAPVALVDAPLARALWDSIVAGRPLGDALMRALKDQPLTAVVEGGWCARITSNRARTEAEARLEAEVGGAVDTRLDTLFHRRLARPLTRLALRWAISPNQITVLSLLAGLAAVWCFWQATPAQALAGLALYALAVILDHADGDVARLALAESAFGARLDVAVDTIIHALLVTAMGVTAQAATGGGTAGLGLIAALGVVGSAVMTRTSPPASGGLGAVLNGLSNRDGFYVMLVLFIVALAVLPPALPALMLVVAVGSHAFWLGRLAYRLRD